MSFLPAARRYLSKPLPGARASFSDPLGVLGGLVAGYLCNEGGGSQLNNIRWDGNNLPLGGTPNWVANGPLGQPTIGGNGSVNNTPRGLFGGSGGTGASISFWMQPTLVPDSSESTLLILASLTNNYNLEWFSGNFRFAINTNAGPAYTSGSVVRPGVPTHVVVSLPAGATTFTVYINGAADQGTTSISPAPNYPAQANSYGKLTLRAHSTALDAIYVWNRPLSDYEAKRLAAEPWAPVELPPLRRLYSLGNYVPTVPLQTGYTLSATQNSYVGVPLVVTVALNPVGAAGATFNVTLTDFGGGGAFTPATVSLGGGTSGSGGTPASPQYVTSTYVPAQAAALTIGGTNTGGYTDPTPIHTTASWPPIVTVPDTITPSGTTHLTVSSGATVGGFGTLSRQLYRSPNANFTPGSGTLIPGATHASDTDTPPGPGLYFYKTRFTDQASPPQVVDAPQAAALIQQAPDDLVVGVIGDSISFNPPAVGVNPPPYFFGKHLQALLGVRRVTLVNGGISGTATSSWLPPSAGGGSTGLYAQVVNGASGHTSPSYQSDGTISTATFVSAGVQWVSICLGVNDSSSDYLNSASVYQANLTAIMAQLRVDLAGTLRGIVLHYPPYTTPGAVIGGSTRHWTEASTGLEQQYQAVIDRLVDNVHIFRGDTSAYPYFALHPEEKADGIHPNVTGSATYGWLWASAMATALGLGQGTARGGHQLRRVR